MSVGKVWKMAWLAGGLCFLAVQGSPGLTQTASRSGVAGPQAASQQAVRLEDAEREIGPLEVKGQRFTVVLHTKRVEGQQGQGPMVDPEFQETVVRMEIRDAAGTVHYERLFPYEAAGDRFEESWSVSARPAAESELIWDEDTEAAGLGVSDDVWLKVRIDGKEGWIHTQEDFQAIGLPQAG